ncbi:acyltransferase family protein [Microbacterium album]|uniref:Acyltransferase n=1 Tax=Microbacterium album TaxID=2053191 RepID=A0A917MKU6_9MICO|nr:acyltransferase [Microbacterium album]GGH34302.1 acyltransferase [Microbacterium album]
MAEPLAVGEPAKHRRLELLDVLRFVAALMVVCFHWFFNGINNGKVSEVGFGMLAPIAIYGYFGVHLFFLISGYVVTQSARGKSAGQFVVGRGVRLFPAYWVAMAATTLVVTFWGNPDMKVTPVQFLANLTMVPGMFDQNAIDGVYWTLTYEISFYLLVFALIMVGLGRFLDAFFPAWAIVMLALNIALPSISNLPYMGTFYAFFASGAIMASIQSRGFSVYRVIGLTAGFAASLLFVARRFPSWDAGHAFSASLPVVLGLITIFFVLIALLWIPRVQTLRIPLSRPTSDLTYPIYLLHAHIGYTVLNRVGTNENLWLVYPAMIVGLIVSAWLLHRIIEVGLRDFWYRAFGLLRAPVDGMQSLLSRRRVPVAR